MPNAVVEGSKVMSARRVKAHDALDRAFGAKEKDWPAYYRALDALCRVVHEEAGGVSSDYISLNPPEEVVDTKPRKAPCVRCKGAGETMLQDRVSSGGEPIYKVGTCPTCRGSGEGKEMVPPKEVPEVVKREDRANVVMQITMAETPLGWAEYWGVLPAESNPNDPAEWLGIFPSRGYAEKFRDAL